MTLQLKSLGTITAAAVAAVVGWSFGGTLGVGVFAGFLFAAAIALWGIDFQTRLARRNPSQVWLGFLVAFVTKFGGLVIGVLAVRFLEPLAARADWRSFLVAYGVTALIVLLLGTPEVSRALKPSTLDSPPTT